MPNNVLSQRRAISFHRVGAEMTLNSSGETASRTRLTRYGELHKNPTRDYYFRNLTFDGNNSSAVQVTGENVLVTGCEANGPLRYFVGSDPRWVDSDHNLAYKFYGFQIVSNRVGQCREAFPWCSVVGPITSTNRGNWTLSGTRGTKRQCRSCSRT